MELILPSLREFRDKFSEMNETDRLSLRAYRTTVPRSQVVRERELVGMVRLSTSEVIDGSEQPDTSATPLLEELRDALGMWPGDKRVGVWGYGSVFDVGYMFRDMWGPYVEIMDKLAFEQSKKLTNIQTSLMRSHQGLGLATTRAGRMAWGTDNFGLGFAASLNLEEADARDLYQKLDLGSTPTDTSVGGSIIKASWNPDYTHYTIQDWSLNRGEISVVHAGANPAGWATLIPEVNVPDQITEIPEPMEV